MTGDAMQPMPMFPGQSPKKIGGAAVQWFCSRRGRIVLLSVIVLTFILGLAGIRHSEAITERYHTLADYRWRLYLSSLPKLTKTPFKTPSNTTLRLENGEMGRLPSKLEKTTPNFHLLMTSEKDSDAFCKSTLSAMLLNYPPPTAINFRQTFISPRHKDRQTLYGIHEYLHSEKLVHDEDLLLIVNGQDTWFQLPSDVIIKQYEGVVEYANAWLLKKYGLDENKHQKFNQTIIFGAGKVCEGDDMACKCAPRSILPNDLYDTGEEGSIEDMPARYLNSDMVMGPAKDLRIFFSAALKKYENKNSKQTIQSVLATMFGEQQLIRDSVLTQDKSATSKLREWVGRTPEEQIAAGRRLEAANVTLLPDEKYEYSIGLDYTHTLFQPLSHATLDELVPLIHENSTNLSKYRHPKTLTPQLSLPPTLVNSKLPFWSPNPYLHNPSPDTNKPAYIDKLEFDNALDRLPDHHTPWSNITLIQNTYTGTVPALILRVPESTHGPEPSSSSSARISFNNLWFAPHKRALLRQYFRTPQSPNGYHNYLVGGDRFWDQRGGRGGVWTSKEQIWLPWGEVDGVCGTLAQLRQIFDDGKGVWMHEREDDNEGQRIRDEEAFRKSLEEKKEKEKEKEKKEKEEEKKRIKLQTAAQISKQEQEQREEEKVSKESLEEAERQKEEQIEKERANLERLTEVERKKKIETEEAEARAASVRHKKSWIA